MTDQTRPEPTLLPGEEVDLSNCDREPIHIPGSIQAHGALLVLRATDLHIVQVSQDIARWVGKSPAALIGQPCAALFNHTQQSLLRNALAQGRFELNPLYLFTCALLPDEPPLDITAHSSDGLVLLELEPQGRSQDSAPDYYTLVKHSLTRLPAAVGLQAFCQQVAEEVRVLCAMDRVMIYRFQPDDSGWVYAESKRDDLEPFLDLHYPASDIPRQARALYLRNWLRLIPDVGYRPQPLCPPTDPLNEHPLDLSFCSLRSVSPVHIEYLQNMGVKASMSISLIKDGALWGLIACHHYAPRYLSYQVRAACEFLGQVVSLQLGAQEHAEHNEYRLKLSTVRERLTAGMGSETDVAGHLLNRSTNLLDFIDASGVAVCINGHLSVRGHTPDEHALRALVSWLAEERDEQVFATDALALLYPDARAFPGIVSGLLAVQVSRKRRDFILWFRPETAQTVNWAGDPHKPVRSGPLGERLTPRQSFAAWRETVRLHAVPWLEVEIEAARKLRLEVMDVVIERVEQLARLNAELAQSNEELDAFAFIASHDLKEPLRGIYSYSQMLLRDLENQLDEVSQERLHALERLAKRMESLIDSLLDYSRVGRQMLDLEDVDLNELLSEALELLSARRAETAIELRVPRPLPILRCDAIQVREVLTNLIGNAIKYRSGSDGWVEIGFLAPGDPAHDEMAGRTEQLANERVFYVRDNGIGIRERHLQRVFVLFKRLHGRDDYGGGTGIGLTIVKKIVERHGGQIWVDSTPGQGSTFYFTLHSEGNW
ncbi:MAG: ATP-binding protein [Gammaproteobacteria bacterium]